MKTYKVQRLCGKEWETVMDFVLKKDAEQFLKELLKELKKRICWTMHTPSELRIL